MKTLTSLTITCLLTSLLPWKLLVLHSTVVLAQTTESADDTFMNDDDILLEMSKERDAFESLPESTSTMNFAMDQEVDGTEEEIAATNEVIRLFSEYLLDEVSKPQYDSVRYLCINKDKLCAFWTSIDECTKNEGFMREHSSLACRSCHLLLDQEL